ncbi:Stk1 family PASTA domain-containing Ser/Thr kinase [Arthrobacter sp. KK5.5]|uniref:Stk1 family PASTA domain-containing Ser/Thr kinase n=1 Tax=Arthrobacter sp. KK5.5 TaxID=3373084 RepID=UPI003EE43713
MTEHGSDPLIGRTVDGRYRVNDRLARGGMSTVYLATDLRLQRDVAVKVLYPHLAEDPRFVQRFEAEAITAARLSHPHVVSVLDQGVDGNIAYLVMEYVRGRTLRDLLGDGGRLSPRRALDLLEDVLEGLSAAHVAGLVHRDMKPENVLLSHDGRVKVADFGLARATSNHTATGTLVGTVAYISPELVTGAPSDARSDIYAVGIMLYELLTGRQPFEAALPINVAFRHVNEVVPPPSNLLPGLAEDIDEIVQWCTAKDPEERPHDAEALLLELRHIRATLTDEQLDFGPPVPTAAPGRRDTPQGTPLDTAGQPHGATEVISGIEGATSVIPAGRNATRAMPRRDPAPPAAAPSVPGDAGPARPPSARQNKRDAKAARKEWNRAAQRPLESLESPGARRRGWLLAAAVMVLAALLATAGWFFGMGPGAAVNVPSLQGKPVQSAVQELAVLGVGATQREVFDEKRERGAVVASEPAAGTEIRKFQDVELLVSRGPELFNVPNIVGRGAADAQSVIEEAALSAGKATVTHNESVPAGRVVSQEPQPDKQVRGTTKVSYVVSLGPAPVAVPDVVGKPAGEATEILESAGLKVEKTEEKFNRAVPAGAVVSQSPGNGKLDRGSAVSLTVSKGPRMVEVPNFVGNQLDQAQAELERLGFEVVVETPLGNFFGTVRSQDPESGRVEEGSTITLVVV